MLTAIIVVLILLFVYIIFIYNRLITNKNLVDEGWSGIQVHLKERANLVPNIVATVRGYAEHETKVFHDVTELRAECLSTTDPIERAQKENQLSATLKSLFAVAEAYPDLKANHNFIELQKTLQNLENQIQAARRYYNATVRDLNILIESFPSNLIAKQFKFKKGVFFELENPNDAAVPKVEF